MAKKKMLNDLFRKLPTNATPLFHSDQGWQYQHAEYQRLLATHDVRQSMFCKGNHMDNRASEPSLFSCAELSSPELMTR